MGLDKRKPVFVSGVRKQHLRRPACISAQTDQRLCYSLFGKNHATNEMSIFLLVSVAEETGLNIALSETWKTGFLRQGPYIAY